MVPGKGSVSELHVIPNAFPPSPEAKGSVKLLKLPSEFNFTLFRIPPLFSPAIKSPTILSEPLKIVEVYSSIPLVLLSQIVTISSFGPSGLDTEGPLQSP